MKICGYKDSNYTVGEVVILIKILIPFKVVFGAVMWYLPVKTTLIKLLCYR